MKLSEIMYKAYNGSLTCSEVVSILMDQPTADGMSHAHMHMIEGFKLDPDAFKTDKVKDWKRQHWEGDSHLFPRDKNLEGRVVFDSSKDLGRLELENPYHVFQDADRLPVDGSYAHRTGLDELPKVVRKTYDVFQFVAPKQKPQVQTYTDLDEVKKLTVGREVGEYQSKSQTDNAIKYIEREELLLPKVARSPAHSLFPDSASMVMYLTAALLSTAGKKVLNYLFWKAEPDKTVGIFSKTAVRAVARVDKSRPPSMYLRTLVVDTTKPRDPTTGRYPATGEIKIDVKTIDHVVVVLGRRSTGELNVTTCYPSAATTEDTIRTKTSSQEDIAEPVLNTHNKVLQLIDPVLKW